MDRLALIPSGTLYCYSVHTGQSGHPEKWFCPYWRGHTKGPLRDRWGECLLLHKRDNPYTPNAAWYLLWDAVKDAECPEFPHRQ